MLILIVGLLLIEGTLVAFSQHRLLDVSEQLAALHDKLDLHQGQAKKIAVHAGKRVECPTCHTTYTYDRLGLKKTSSADKSIVQCLCGATIRITFDAEGHALCQV